jgi:hypothetical protein
MCPRPEPCSCASGVCTPIIRAKSWPGAGRSWAKGRWRHPRFWRGSPRAREGLRCSRSAVRSVGSCWCARPSCPSPTHPHQQRRCGRQWPEREGVRGKSGADPEGTSVASRGAQEIFGAPDRATLAPTPADGGADRPGCMGLEPHEGATQGRTGRPISIVPSTITSCSVRGPSNPVLKRTAASSGVSLSI